MQYNVLVEKSKDPTPHRRAHTLGHAASRVSPRGPGRREIAKAEKRARILAAARSLMSEKGYAQMSMSEVASRADVAAGTVFQYAATKAELLMMVTENIWADHVNRTLEATPDLGHRSPAAVVDAIMDSLAPVFDMAVHWPETTVWIAREILFGEDLPHRREVLVLVEKLEAHIARMLGGCRPTGPSPHTGHLDVGARMIVTSGLAELNRARQGRAEMHLVLQRMREIVALVAAGVGTAHAPAHDAAVPASPESAR
ncbi:TetR/AcrR family transcriptional regulator [Kocuria rhizophila]|uniref:TetR/AcrR family transcriptional regulator n=1 Tax=Kocuria rhizophila TaxID=72000 RepID=UPI0021A4F439|nr:TetR/AcrR family transcriptional regulator [Kocuria rhizophila]MCT1879324.1 TetR/AcrR family transcriptional regulator [Kocuria rhizophila]